MGDIADISGSCSCLTLMQQRCSKDMIARRFTFEYGVPISAAQDIFLSLLQQTLYPSPPREWLRALLKAVVETVELSGHSCLDEIVELAILTSLSKSSAESEFDHSKLNSGEGHTIYRLITRDIFIRKMKMHNEVGTKIWTAGLLLSEFCAQNSYLFENANVLELGSGVGITGITVAANELPPSRVIMTDFSAATMENLCYNLSINIENDSAGSGGMLPPITAKELDWSLCTDEETIRTQLEFSPGDIDVILAADCAYSPDLCILLISALEVLLSIASTMRSSTTKSSTGPKNFPHFINADYPFAIVMSTLRNPDTFEVFLKVAADSPMTCSDITEWSKEQTTLGRFFIPTFESHTDEVKVHCFQYFPDKVNEMSR